MPSVLWRCWLGGRKGIQPVKNWVVRCWHGYSVWGEVQICIWPSWCHSHSLSLAPVNPDCFYSPGFTFLVPAHLGSPRHSPGDRKMVVVVVVVVVYFSYFHMIELVYCTAMSCEGSVSRCCQFQAAAHSQEVAGEFQDDGCDVVQRFTDRRDCWGLHCQHQVIWDGRYLLQQRQSQ